MKFLLNGNARFNLICEEVSPTYISNGIFLLEESHFTTFRTDREMAQLGDRIGLLLARFYWLFITCRHRYQAGIGKEHLWDGCCLLRACFGTWLGWRMLLARFMCWGLFQRTKEESSTDNVVGLEMKGELPGLTERPDGGGGMRGRQGGTSPDEAWRYLSACLLGWL